MGWFDDVLKVMKREWKLNGRLMNPERERERLDEGKERGGTGEDRRVN